jgi:phosphotransferase system HPr (HPr) family protein
MPSKSVVVGSAVGLHARPAAIIAEKAGELDAGVTINGVDASSSLMLMTLGAKNGTSRASRRHTSTGLPGWGLVPGLAQREVAGPDADRALELGEDVAEELLLVGLVREHGDGEVEPGEGRQER